MKITKQVICDAKGITSLAAFVACGALRRGSEPPKRGLFSRMMRNKRKSGNIFSPESLYGNKP